MRKIIALTALLIAPASLATSVAAPELASGEQRQDTVVRQTGNPVYPGVATLREIVSIGQSSGLDEYMFAAPQDVHLAWDGSVIIADAGNANERIGPLSTIRRYDSTGKYVRSYGRGGQGPGEFRDFNGMNMLRDGRILLNDASARAIHVFPANGATGTSWSIPRQSLSAGTTSFFVNPDGNIYLTFSTSARPAAPARGSTPARPAVPADRFAIHVNPLGQIVDTIRPPQPPEIPTASVSVTGASGTQTRRSVPFMPSFRTEFSHLGYYVTARSDRYAIDLNMPGGQVVSIRRNVQPVPVTAEERTAHRDSMIATMRRTDSGWNWNGPDIPRVKPFFQTILTDYEGRIWVRVNDASEKTIPNADQDDESINYWEVFEPSGRFLGKVRTPVGAHPNYGRGDRMIGVAQNADGVTRVIVYRIQWSAER